MANTVSVDAKKTFPTISLKGRGRGKSVRYAAPEMRDSLFQKPTPERSRQNGGVRKQLVAEDPKSKATTPRHKARAECQLDIYLIRGAISDEQHAAGILFREAYQRAALRIQTRNSIMVAVDESKTGARDAQAKESLARQRYIAAMKILTLVQREVVVDVCSSDQTAGGERRLKELRKGLQSLADLWRVKIDEDFRS